MNEDTRRYLMIKTFGTPHFHEHNGEMIWAYQYENDCYILDGDKFIVILLSKLAESLTTGQ